MKCALWLGTLPIYSVPKDEIKEVKARLRKVKLGLRLLPDWEKRGYIYPVMVFPLKGFEPTCPKCRTVQCEADRALNFTRS